MTDNDLGAKIGRAAQGLLESAGDFFKELGEPSSPLPETRQQIQKELARPPRTEDPGELMMLLKFVQEAQKK